MSTIIGSRQNDALYGRSGADTLIGKGGHDTLVGNQTGGSELLVDGSFENAKIGPKTWGTVQSVGGWRTDTSIEIWGKDFGGVTATHGDKIMELDSDKRVSRVWQDVQTEAGQSYDFSFDYAMRGSTAAATNTIEIYWNNALVGRFDPTSTQWSKGALSLVGTGGVDRLEFREDKADNDSLGGLIDNVSLRTSGTGNDTLEGGSGSDALSGLGGDDVIYGGGKPSSAIPTKETTVADNDVIHAGDGNDTAYGNNGDDAIYGDNGHDALFGGRGDDVVDGGAGNDNMFGNSGDDKMTGGSGNDYVSAGSGNDIVYADTGDDTYFGGSGFDILSFYDAKSAVKVDLSKHVASGMGQDRIFGFEGAEGSRFDDMLKGGKGDDALSGGEGNDVLRGHGGSDVLGGGEGRDTFLWKIADLKQQVSTGTVDRITDFANDDHLDLRDLTQGMSMDDILKMISFKDDGVNTHMFVDLGSGHSEFAVLENFAGHSAKDMIAEGHLLT